MQEVKKAAEDEEMSTKELVRFILQGTNTFPAGEAPAWAQKIDDHVDRGCMLIYAAQAYSKQACAERLMNNPSRDISNPISVLREEMAKHDAYIKEHGEPKFADAYMQEPIEALIEEMMTRNALYTAFGAGEIPQEYLSAMKETFVMDERLRRDCACTMAIWLYMTGEATDRENDMDVLAVKACALYRLGYLDHHEIEKLIAKVKETLAQEEQEAENEDERSQIEESAGQEARTKGRLLSLCAAGLAGAAAFVLLSPYSVIAGIAAVILIYRIIS